MPANTKSNLQNYVKKSQDEAIDGAKVAAQIINRMKENNKTKIIARIKATNPDIAQRIEEKMFRFDDIADLTDQGVQLLIKEIDHQSLVISLKTASAEVKEMLFKNMSERKKIMVEDDFINLPPMRLSEVETAQRSILNRLDQLRTAGAIRTNDVNDVWV